MKDGEVVFLRPDGKVLRAKLERPVALAGDLVASNRAQGLRPWREPDPLEVAGQRVNIDYVAQGLFFSPALQGRRLSTRDSG